MSAIEQALEMHEKWNGKIETTAKSHVNSREDLAIPELSPKSAPLIINFFSKYFVADSFPGNIPSHTSAYLILCIRI